MIELSPEQQAIVDHPLQPLRVEAGAGTGKTTTLAHRVVTAIEGHGLAPHQILGVTFTNKAAEELSTRITETTDLAADSQVDVYTYHGFAAQLLTTHGALVGVERHVSIISTTSARQILEDSIRDSSFELLDITHRPTIVNAALKLANELADNLCTPESILSTAPISEVDARRHELAEALVLFARSKEALGVVDYGDLIRLAVRLVTEHPRLVERLTAQYRCVLLDEYQDTNPAQRQLFRTIFGEGTAVTAVGDPDQTIYEWRGATPDNFASFPEHFALPDTATPTLPLTLNRRSGQAIADLANLVRRQITTTTPGPDLVVDGSHGPGRIGANWYSDARIEAEAIAAEAHRLHDEEHLKWSDIAILFRKNKDMSLVRDALDEHGVPLQVANLGGLLGIPEIVEIRSWLRLVANPEDAPAVARILLGSRYRLGLADLALLSRWARQTGGDDLTHTLIEALDHLDDLDLDDEPRRRLVQFRSLHRRLLTAAQGASLIELTRTLLSETGAWQEMDAMPYPAGLSARLNVHRFLDLVEEWSPLEGRPSLDDFLDYLDLMAEDPVEELDTARVGSDDAVTLMTVHRAKGLEWEAVFLPALYHGNFPSFGRGADPALRHQAVPAELRLDGTARERLALERSESARKDWLSARHVDQEWRLAYVAVTRARSHLHLSGAQWYGAPEPNKRISKPSAFLEQARGVATSGLWEHDPHPRPDVLRYPPAAIGPDPVFDDGWDAALRAEMSEKGWAARRAAERGLDDLYDAAVDEFQQMLFALPEPTDGESEAKPTQLSVTGMVTYADCPKRFFWSEVDRLPRRASEASRRGVELHRRIELFSRGIVPFEELTPELYDRATDEDSAGPGSPKPWDSFTESRYARDRPVFTEIPFEVRLEGRTEEAWLRGRVDAVYEITDGWEIVDFKSGKRSSRPAASVQLQAYALAAAQEGFGVAPPDTMRVSFVYLGDGLDVVSAEVDDAWLEDARATLNSLVDGVQAERFDASPSPACHGCDFLTFCDEGTAYIARPPS